jgi:hypothetical protein
MSRKKRPTPSTYANSGKLTPMEKIYNSVGLTTKQELPQNPNGIIQSRPANKRRKQEAAKLSERGDKRPRINTTEEPETVSQAKKPGGRIYKFPQNIGDAPLYLKLEFCEYEQPDFFNTLNPTPNFDVYLPLPDQLFENYAVDINESDIGLTGDILKAFKGGFGAAARGNIGDAAMAVGEAAGSALYRSGLNLANENSLVREFGIENLGDVIAQGIGSVPNPHKTMFFNGVNLRDHNLIFRLSAESKSESKDLQEMFRRVKNAILPRQSAYLGVGTLDYPNIIKPSICSGSNEAPYSYEFKWCFANKFSIFHTPDGMPAFNTDLSPTTYQITIDLQEIEIFTSDLKSKKESA